MFFQVAIHAIGDKANDMLLGMFDKLVNLNGMKDRRFRVFSDSILQIFSPRIIFTVVNTLNRI